jgi:hypothetical protein
MAAWNTQCGCRKMLGIAAYRLWRGGERLILQHNLGRAPQAIRLSAAGVILKSTPVTIDVPSSGAVFADQSLILVTAASGIQLFNLATGEKKIVDSPSMTAPDFFRGLGARVDWIDRFSGTRFVLEVRERRLEAIPASGRAIENAKAFFAAKPPNFYQGSPTNRLRPHLVICGDIGNRPSRMLILAPLARTSPVPVFESHPDGSLIEAGVVTIPPAAERPGLPRWLLSSTGTTISLLYENGIADSYASVGGLR